MQNKLIKNFTFNEKIRDDLIFSDITKIRLNTEGGDLASKVQLKLDANGRYPLDSDLYIETPLITPNAVQTWLKFEIIAVEDEFTGFPRPEFGFRVKVKTTAGNYWWDGAAWALAGAGDWNTEQEINANISTFPIATIGNKSIGFVVNISTSNDAITPELKEVKIAGLFDIEFFEDLIYDSLIRKLNTEFRSTSVIVVPSTGSASLNLNTVLENKKYNITGITKVVDKTADALKLVNLFSLYSPGAARQDGFTNEPGTVTFSGAIPLNNLIEITFEYVPEIMINTGVDYYEEPAFPALVFENIDEVDIRGFKIKDTNGRERDFIRDKVNLTAILEMSPEQRDYRFNYAVYTGSQLDQTRLPEDLKRFWANNKVVKSWGLDQDYDINITAEFSTGRNQKETSFTDSNVATGSFDVLGVLFFQRQAEDVPLVGQGQLNVDFN